MIDGGSTGPRARDLRRRAMRLLPIGLVLAGAMALLAWRLGAVYLWQDEAATAVLALRMLERGKPLAWDGQNLITMDSFADEDLATIDGRTGSAEASLRYLVARGDFKPDSTWIGQPWGQFVVAGASLAWLGRTTFAARLPFVLAAFLTVLLLYLLTRRLFGEGAAVVAAGLLASNAYWILHARQCRYYALSSLCLLVSIITFLRWRRGGAWGAAAFVGAAWLYFQVDFGSFFPTMAVLAIVAMATAPGEVKRVLAVFGLLGAAVAPFAWYYQLASRLRQPIGSWAERFLRNAHNLNLYVLALPLLGAAAWLLWRRRRSLGEEPRMLLASAVGAVAALLIWVPTVAPAAFHRYIVQATPLAMLVAAWLASEAADALARPTGRGWIRPGAAVVGAAVLGGSHLAGAPAFLAINGGLPPALRVELGTAIDEIFLERPDPNRMVIERIGPALRPGDEVLVNYEDVPFMFYTSARVRGGVSAFRVEDRSGAPPKYAVMRTSVAFVHWPVFARELARHRWQQLPSGAPDIPFGNIPDPAFLPRPAATREIAIGERVP